MKKFKLHGQGWKDLAFWQKRGILATVMALRERTPDLCAAHLDRFSSVQDLRECRRLLEGLDRSDAFVAQALSAEDLGAAEAAAFARVTWKAALEAVEQLERAVRRRGVVRLLGEAYARAESVRQDPERTTLGRRAGG